LHKALLPEPLYGDEYYAQRHRGPEEHSQHRIARKRECAPHLRCGKRYKQAEDYQKHRGLYARYDAQRPAEYCGVGDEVRKEGHAPRNDEKAHQRKQHAEYEAHQEGLAHEGIP
jgi:hypothetical protein